MSGGDRAGDWSCPNTDCINNTKMVFARHATCPKCGSPPDGAPAASGPPQSGPSNGGRPGDWNCPNQQCVNSFKGVFARHATCPKCGIPKPAGGGCGGAYVGYSPSPMRFGGGGG